MPLSLTGPEEIPPARPAGTDSSMCGWRMVIARLALVAVLCPLYGTSANAETEFAGKARVVDAQTLEVGGRLVRLFGVSAPPTDETCLTASGQRWACGEEAAFTLAFETGNRWLTCRERFRDAGLTVATCLAGPYDIAALMVRKGWAIARPDESQGYIKDEEKARSDGQGMWREGSRPTGALRRR